MVFKRSATIQRHWTWHHHLSSSYYESRVCDKPYKAMKNKGLCTHLFPSVHGHFVLNRWIQVSITRDKRKACFYCSIQCTIALRWILFYWHTSSDVMQQAKCVQCICFTHKPTRVDCNIKTCIFGSVGNQMYEKRLNTYFYL